MASEETITTPAPTPSESTLPAPTEAEIIAEATAAPELSKDEFLLGGRTFTVVSLKYRQYLQFVSKLEPVLKALGSKLKAGVTQARDNKVSISVPGIVLQSLDGLDAGYIMQFCAEEIPAMVEIVCNMAVIKDPTQHVTKEWIEDNAESPFELLNIVLAQINKNKMIVQFAHFFAQVLPMLLGSATSQAE